MTCPDLEYLTLAWLTVLVLGCALSVYIGMVYQQEKFKEVEKPDLTKKRPIVKEQ